MTIVLIAAYVLLGLVLAAWLYVAVGALWPRRNEWPRSRWHRD